MDYAEETLTIKKGDMIYLYTDGVTEALNPEEKLYGESRLMETANRNIGSGLQEFVFSIKADIDTFAKGAEQADDITMLAMKYRGSIDEGTGT